VITNHPIWRGGRPVLWPDAQRPPVESSLLYAPDSEWAYSHHPHIAGFRGRLFAIWSNGHRDEDAPGQRVLLSSAREFRAWSEPRVLAAPSVGPDGRENVLTAAGFHQHDGTLVAYFAEYGPEKQATRLFAVTTKDGERWSRPLDLGVAVCPNHGPRGTASGRLIITGNISFPFTDDRSGLAGWRMAGIYGERFDKDDPAEFWEVARRRGWPAALCEGAFHETDDGVLHMLLRSTGPGFRHRLWLTESRDDGVSWSEPVETDFSDTNAKFHMGRLPDGRFTYVGNPVGENRTPLALSLSADGESFDRHFVLGDAHYERRRAGTWKEGEYGYPHSIVDGDWFIVIVSRQKEGVEVLRVRVSSL
jgi:hypothetical protein